MLAIAEQGSMVGPGQEEKSCSPNPLSLPTIVLASAHTPRSVWLRNFCVLIAKRPSFCFVGLSSSSLNWAIQKGTRERKSRNKVMKHHKMPDCLALMVGSLYTTLNLERTHLCKEKVSWEQSRWLLLVFSLKALLNYILICIFIWLFR